jgi:hypothetical protein
MFVTDILLVVVVFIFIGMIKNYTDHFDTAGVQFLFQIMY